MRFKNRTAPGIALACLATSSMTAVSRAQCQSYESSMLASADVHAGDEHGRAVDINGAVAVVGAPRDENGLGAAYVYEFDGERWNLMAHLTASDLALGDEFGCAVAVEDDLVVVGSHMPFPAERPGAVYVFQKPAGGWTEMTETARLTASDGQPNDNFGHAVDVDGGTIAVGAYLEDGGGVNAGAAYVFEMPAGGWSETTETGKLTAGDPNENDQFGISVSLSGDAVLVGVDRDSDVVYQGGSAYVFVEPAGGWTDLTHTAKLTASSPVDLDRFGLSVSISGDTAAVGAWGDDQTAQKAGAVYVFEKPGAGWNDMNESAKLTASDAAAGDHLGWSVDIHGGIVAAGAPANLFDGSGPGAVYLYMEPASGWSDASEAASVTASHAAENDEFGVSVSVDDHRLAAGARFHDTGGFSNAGAAFLYGGAADCDADHSLDLCQIVDGSPDADGDGILDSCQTDPCPADSNDDGQVNVDDLVAVIQGWGICSPGPCAGDTNGDQLVNVNDLNDVIVNWGPCTP